MKQRNATVGICAALGMIVTLVAHFGVRVQHFGLPPEAVQQTQEFVASLPAIQVVGADSDEENQSKRVVLDSLLLKANGGTWPWHGPQETGDCASQTFGIAIELDEAVQIDEGADITFRPVYRPWLYSGGRTRNGKVSMSGQGSIPAWIADFVETKGVLWADEPNVPPYSGSTADAWGRKPPPAAFEATASQYTVNNIAAVRNAQDVCNAIVAGYPVAFGSMNFGTNSIKIVGGRNVARDTTNWPHAQCCSGYDGTMPGQRLFRIVNSWNPWPSVKSQMPGDHPGGYYVTWETMDSICREGMAFAVSGTQGFKQREFVPDFSVIGAAGPPADQVQPAQETIAMFPLDPDFQVPLYCLGGALVTFAGALYWLGNFKGRPVTGAAALMLALMLPAMSAAQEFSPDFTILATIATGPERAVTTSGILTSEFRPDFTIIASTANAATVEAPPIDFSRLVKFAQRKCDCVDCQCEDCDGNCPSKDKPADKPAGTAVRQGYPERGTWWTHPGSIRQHFMANHAAQFDHQWLSQLTDRELEALHSDLHDRTVKPQAVYAKQLAADITGGRWVMQRFCVGGVCTYRRVWMPN